MSWRLVAVARSAGLAVVLGAGAGGCRRGALAHAAAPGLIHGAVGGGEADLIPRLRAEGPVPGRLEVRAGEGGRGHDGGGGGDERRAHGHAFRELTISSLVMWWPSVRKRTVLMVGDWPEASVSSSA